MKKECGICHARCTDPEVLPCEHCYCKQCIRGPALRAGIIKPFPCPECGRDTILPTAFFVECMKEREFKADESIVKESSLQECKKHKKELEAYCYQCQHLICDYCIKKDCRDHKFEFPVVAVPKEKEKFREQLEPLKRGIMEGLQALEKLQATRFEMEDQGCSVANRIESSFEELFKVMQNHKQELLREVASQVRHKLKRISDQEKSLSTKIASLQRAVDYAERCVDHLAGKAFMDMRLKIQDGLDSVKGNVEVGKNVEPVEEVDIGVELIPANDMKQFCQTNLKIAPLSVDATTCVISGEGVKSAEVKKMSEFRVIAKLSNGKPTKKTCIVESYLKSLSTNPIIECHVDLIGGGEYRIQYTPIVRGRHELMVTVNGQEVTGSPFPVFVSIHPTQLGKPVQKMAPGMVLPGYLALTPAGNIIVAEWQAIIMLDNTGKKLMKLAYVDPQGVAVDSTDGCVYVTDNSSNNSKIIKLSPDLKQKQVFNSNSKLHYRGVSVVGDEVMVCCCNNGIMVYTKQLEYVREIGSHGDGPGQFRDFCDVCPDEHGNLYVCDYSKSCVQVFSNDGEYLCSFGEKKLKRPQSVCVSGQYVYVITGTSNGVFVFTTCGAYVTTISNTILKIFRPTGVCVDKDGFVYVSCASYSESDSIMIY